MPAPTDRTHVRCCECRGHDLQLFEIAATARSFEPVVIHSESIGEVLAEGFRGPAAKRRLARPADSVADRDDHLEVVDGTCPPGQPIS